MTQETNDVVTQELIERLRARRKRELTLSLTGVAWEPLINPDGPKAADALQSQSARIAELEGERSAAIELCDTSVTQCPFSKGRAPAASKPCPKCKAVSAEPCRLQVQAAFEAVRLLKLAASLTKDSTSG